MPAAKKGLMSAVKGKEISAKSKLKWAMSSDRTTVMEVSRPGLET